MLEQIKGKLVVSCQALEDEPLHSPQIMAKMALAAMQGGAAGIRANSVADITAIRQEVALPVLGIIKRHYAGSEVFITPTLQEVDELMRAEPAMIALDATDRARPDGETLAHLVAQIRRRYPQLLLMADTASIEQARHAEKLGFDCVGTTLYGYTPQTKGRSLPENDCRYLQEMLSAVRIPVIAEGNVDTPQTAARCLALGAHAVVVGGAITRPQQITRRFVDALSA